ncbi:conserved exported hypothetical protein [Gammaproteobacteria bacterium]
MKKTVFAILAVLTLVAAAWATAPAAYSTAVPEWIRDTTISAAAGKDTLVGVDSMTLFSLRPMDQLTEYILVRDAITGGGSDSVKVQVSLRCYDENSALLYVVAVDSFTAAAGEAVLLPIGGSAFGMKFTLKLVGYTDNGGESIQNRISVWKRRPVQINKNYR